MGHTAVEWARAVLTKLNDANENDMSVDDVFAVGVVPALAQYSIDRPHSAVVDLTPTERYLSLPTSEQGWVPGWSDIVRIEAPAGQTPPRRLDQGEWVLTRDPTTPATTVVLLPFQLASGDEARVFFTTTWPTPAESDATVDQVSALAFEPVTALAAAYVCTALAASSAQGRQGALPTDYVDGTERARNLLDAAARLQVLYNTFIGLGSVTGAASTSVSARALRSVRFG